MRDYKVIVLGSFLILPKVVGYDVGMYSTFLTSAASANGAIKNIKINLIERLKIDNIGLVKNGFFKTYFSIHGIWEVTDSSESEEKNIHDGASFFRIGVLDKFVLGLRRVALQKLRPWLLIDL